jgi:hypothetical protein
MLWVMKHLPSPPSPVAVLRQKTHYIVPVVTLAWALVPLLPSTSFAASSQTIAQGFRVKDSSHTLPGTLVSTSASDSAIVELATAARTPQLVGVVDASPLLTISADDTTAQVVVSGTVNVLVSDINGPIGAGDKITASPIAGVGMRATGNGQVAGIAQALFKPADSQPRTVKDVHGKSHIVHVGFIPMRVGVAYYQAPGSSLLPPFIQQLANTIVGRSVSLVRVLAAGLLLVIGLTGITALIYTTARSAMISLGRNPLAAPHIRKSLYQVLGVAAAAIITVLLTAYLILAI